MADFINTGFPKKFGKSPEDFLEKYGRLIYKMIYQRAQNTSEMEIDDLFNSFFIHISEEGFKRLKLYKGDGCLTAYLGKILRNFMTDKFREKASKIRSGFKLTDQSLEKLITDNLPENIIDLLKDLKDQVYKTERQLVEELKTTIGEKNTETYKSLIFNRIQISQFEVIKIEETDIPIEPNQEYMLVEEESRLIKQALKKTFLSLTKKERLIFSLTYFREWDALRIAKVLDIKRSSVFESNRKVRAIFEKELEERGISINKKHREKGANQPNLKITTSYK